MPNLAHLKKPHYVGSDRHIASWHTARALPHTFIGNYKVWEQNNTGKVPVVRRSQQPVPEHSSAAPLLPPQNLQQAASDMDSLSLSLHYPPGTISLGRTHECRIWLLLALALRVKPWCSHGKCQRQQRTECSVPRGVGMLQVQLQKGYKHTVVFVCPEEQQGNGAPCSLLISAVLCGAVRALGASLCSSGHPTTSSEVPQCLVREHLLCPESAATSPEALSVQPLQARH